jgi:hypothetical protein
MAVGVPKRPAAKPKGRDGSAAGEVLGVLIAAGASLAMTNPARQHVGTVAARSPAFDLLKSGEPIQRRRAGDSSCREHLGRGARLGGAMPDEKISGIRSKTGRCLRGAKRC